MVPFDYQIFSLPASAGWAVSNWLVVLHLIRRVLFFTASEHDLHFSDCSNSFIKIPSKVFHFTARVNTRRSKRSSFLLLPPKRSRSVSVDALVATVISLFYQLIAIIILDSFMYWFSQKPRLNLTCHKADNKHWQNLSLLLWRGEEKWGEYTFEAEDFLILISLLFNVSLTVVTELY